MSFSRKALARVGLPRALTCVGRRCLSNVPGPEPNPSALSSLTGLEQMRRLGQVFETKLGIGQTLQFKMEECSYGRVVFEGTPGEFAYNPINTVHGGYAATLLDSACACSLHTMLQPGQSYTTLDLNVSYLVAMTSKTGLVRAEGKVLKIGRRAGFAEAKITDASGRVIATATSTLLVMGESKSKNNGV